MPDKKKKSALGRLAEFLSDKVGDAAEYVGGRSSGEAMKNREQGKKNAAKFREVMGSKKRIDLGK